MSGAGLTPSNFNAATSDSKLSGRDVPMVEVFSQLPFARATVKRRFIALLGDPTQFRDSVD